MPEHRNYDAYTMQECWEAVLGGPLGYGKDDGFNLEKAIDKSKSDPFTLFDLGSKLYTLASQLNTLRTNVYDLFNSLVGGTGDVTNVPWQGPAADTFRRIGFGIVDFIDKNLKAIWTATYRYDSLVTDSGTNLQTARDTVYNAYMKPQNWEFKLKPEDVRYIRYNDYQGMTAAEVLYWLGIPNRAMSRTGQDLGLVYHPEDYDLLKTADWFPSWEYMELEARPAVKELANKYTIRSSQFEPLPTEPDYENAPPPPKSQLAVAPKEDKDEDKDDLKIDFDPPKFDLDKNGLDDLKGPPDGLLKGPPDLNGLTGPPDLNGLLNQKPPGDLGGLKKLPGGFDLNGDGKPDLDANGNPLLGLGKKVPGGFDIDGDGKADLDANGNPLPSNTKLNRLGPPDSNLKLPGGDLKPPGTDLLPPNLGNLKDPSGDGGGNRLPPPFVTPPGGLGNLRQNLGGSGGLGSNGKLPGFGGGGLGLGNDLKGPAGNSLGQSGVKGGAGGVGTPFGGPGMLGRQGLGGVGGGYPPPMHPHGAGGKKENEERERQTWLMEDDEVWADPEEASGALGRPTDDEES